MEYLDVKFDFELDSKHFMEWLKLEHPDDEYTGDYSKDCCTMCEYACLYIAMLLYNKPLQGEMKIYYGKFSFFEHYWIGYKFNGHEYFIDLTLKQFIDDAPELSIIEPHNYLVSGYSYKSEGEPIKEYIKRQQAFKFYHNPITLAPPPINIHNLTQLPSRSNNIFEDCITL